MQKVIKSLDLTSQRSTLKCAQNALSENKHGLCFRQTQHCFLSLPFPGDDVPSFFSPSYQWKATPGGGGGEIWISDLCGETTQSVGNIPFSFQSSWIHFHSTWVRVGEVSVSFSIFSRSDCAGRLGFTYS